jgi:hypothetical protein
MTTMSKYKEKERAEALKKNCFKGVTFGGTFMGKERDFVLINCNDNFYQPILPEVLSYFKENKISWWRGVKPIGHILSSQIACLNHLFAIRNDKNEVLKIAQNISEDFVDVLKIETDVKPAYISFEAVSETDYLNECKDESLPTRGSHCTSIDALIVAKHKNGKKILIPIEWKYTEHYDNTDKSTEDRDGEAKGTEGKGKERLERYSDLITKSEQLSLKKENYRNSVYFFEPFYQLMRQTLWAEQMIKHADKEIVKADDFLHVHVIPSENKDLLDKNYKCSGKGMEITWRECLQEQNKYRIISPNDLLKGINENLILYLSDRYGMEY